MKPSLNVSISSSSLLLH